MRADFVTLTLEIGDYCDVYLTHDSMSVRKAHNAGRNHLRNVVEYYQRKLGPLPEMTCVLWKC